VHYVYKLERNGPHSRFYVIHKFLRHAQLLTVHIEDSDLGLVSDLLSYPAAQAAFDELNRTSSERHASI
jgi:hypothetical protein